LGRLDWQLATVVDTTPETPRATTLTLAVPDWDGHLPGQHVDVRLTAEDGYQSQRSYSIASVPDGRHIQLLIERLDEGKSPRTSPTSFEPATCWNCVDPSAATSRGTSPPAVRCSWSRVAQGWRR
jgi:hypothetical protein